ncbi:nitroreductase [Cellulophaga baltica]|uniref:nitroreductase family protein n=1 Tax=Cellulophaga TaxID=104264 RepID=UPI001C067ADF|nr:MULTISPECIES: nitroreductase [Cellulophaga]MBU2995247.1 nitroreductase [Cellulophaga baltica]MDO6766642.1 nitroreductase [Cellulophaga sp. 1_MG-2023]
MLFDLIKNRRSVFPAQYNDQPIAKETIEKVLEAANWAPSHRKTEPWRFKVLQGESKEKLGLFLSLKYLENDASPKEFKAKKIIQNPKSAAAVIAICMQRDPEESVPEWEEVAAVAMAVQNMWLMCTELGIGAYWSSPGLIKYMGEFFEMNRGEVCLGFFYMGNYDEKVSDAVRMPLEDKVDWL